MGYRMDHLARTMPLAGIGIGGRFFNTSSGVDASFRNGTKIWRVLAGAICTMREGFGECRGVVL